MRTGFGFQLPARDSSNNSDSVATHSSGCQGTSSGAEVLPGLFELMASSAAAGRQPTCRSLSISENTSRGWPLKQDTPVPPRTTTRSARHCLLHEMGYQHNGDTPLRGSARDMVSSTSFLPCGSSMEVGSSSTIRSLGCMAKTPAIVTLCFCPPGQLCGACSRYSSIPTASAPRQPAF